VRIDHNFDFDRFARQNSKEGKMTNYIIRRLLLVPLLLFGVTVLIFLMLQLLTPVERSALYIRDIPKNEMAVQGVIKLYGLDKPVYVQYWNWLVGKVDSFGVRHGGIVYGYLGGLSCAFCGHLVGGSGCCQPERLG
jgi:hypothetical protein